ncbi:MAG: bifunctional oligoribonuclease/PAP phosphatase NrnA [Gemmatimonadota bacterium]
MTARRETRAVSAPPAARSRGLQEIQAALEGCRRIILTTHLNADGDGAGSETALAHRLRRRGAEPVIVNPTPFPEGFAFLLDGLPAHTPAEPAGRRALERGELLVVLDTAEISRLGSVPSEAGDLPLAVLDHHPPQGTGLSPVEVRDPSACATGELVYDLLMLSDQELSLNEAVGLYVAIATDTGAFRFSNTSVRAHEIAARLIAAGVEPEALYRRLYAQYTPARLSLLRIALASLRTDPTLPIVWVTITEEGMRSTGATWEDLEGIVEYPRRLKGTEVAILFRELAGGRTKVSLRSNGAVDVAAVAAGLGGGGHIKAAGVVVERPLQEAERIVVERVREAVRESGL